MLKQIKERKNEQGFTIIEVLIVLAIAGLIMVVVFLAVPSLQRSQRNNALSTDANNVLTAVNNFSSDNGGAVPTGPTSSTPSSGSLSITGPTGTNSENVKVDGNLSTLLVGGTTITNTSAIGTVQVITGTTAVCNSTDSGLSGTGSARSVAVLYVADGNGTNPLKCVD
jgi:type IV pilus assembly protein PilA